MSTSTKPQARQQQTQAQAKTPAQAKQSPEAKSPMPERSPENRQASEDEVRALAYGKWQQAGSPDSDGIDFWLAAEMELLRRQKPR